MTAPCRLADDIRREPRAESAPSEPSSVLMFLAISLSRTAGWRSAPEVGEARRVACVGLAVENAAGTVYVTDYGNKQVVTTGGRGDATFAVFLVKPIESGRI
jgi:hypothetical protein